MANYKTANQLPILEEVTETTYALVEDCGTLKRVSGSNLGGKNNCCVISIEKPEAMESDVESTGSDGTIYTCNMTYDELMEALQTKTLNGFNLNVYSGVNLYVGTVMYVYFGDDASGIMINYEYNNGNNEGTLQFSADNTIAEDVSAGPS